MKKDIDNQIINYITNSCSKGEREEIERLIKTDSEYKKLFNEYQKVWDIASPSKANIIVDKEKAWQNVSSKIDTNVNSTATTFNLRSLYYYTSGIAATILITIALFFFLKPNSNQTENLLAFSDSHKELTLPDNSVIVLNDNSEIKYNQDFNKKNRDISLTGEGFFEVEHNDQMPFVVSAGDLFIKVVGTSFNINNIDNKQLTEITVFSGRVHAYSLDKNGNKTSELFISKGEQAVFDKTTKTLTTVAEPDANTISWKTGKLSFNANNLECVFNAISKHYKTHFNVSDGDINKMQLTAEFDNDPLEVIVQTISVIHNLNIDKVGDEFIVTKK